MQYIESSVKIFFTSDYSQFKMINGNRELNERKIKRIKTDIANGIDVLKYCPILVVAKDGRLEIIDGQHRFWVTKEMKRPVYYVITDKINLEGIAKINSNTEKWKGEDFLNCYAQLGNEHYLKLQAFIDSYNVSITTALVLLTKGYEGKDSGSSVNEHFTNGVFRVLYEDDAKAIMNAAIKFNKFKAYKSRAFLISISKVLVAKKCDITDIVKKFEADPERLEKQSNYKDYLVNLENIYNKGSHTRKTIF